MMGMLGANIIDKLTSSITDSTAKSVVNAAFPKVEEILTRERNRLADAVISGLPWVAASGMAAAFTYYLAPSPAWKALGYASAALLTGAGSVVTLNELKTDVVSQVTQQSSRTVLDPYIQTASQQLVAAADPKVRQIIQEERARVTNALQLLLPWASGAALGALATAFLIPGNEETLKILGWLLVIAILSYGSWISLEAMKQQ